MPVVATGRPSLAALPGHRVGPWAVGYADHGIGTAGLGIGRRDVAEEIESMTLALTSSPPTYPFLSPQLPHGRKRRLCKRL